MIQSLFHYDCKNPIVGCFSVAFFYCLVSFSFGVYCYCHSITAATVLIRSERYKNDTDEMALIQTMYK